MDTSVHLFLIMIQIMKKYVMMVSLGAVLIMNMFAQEREEPQLEKWAVASLDGKELPAQWIYICIDPVTNTLCLLHNSNINKTTIVYKSMFLCIKNPYTILIFN